MNKKQKERLLKLYNYMCQPQRKLAHKKFDFGHYNINLNLTVEAGRCGTCGCMAGELPVLYPKYWSWYGFGLWYSPSKSENEVQSLAEFFGLNYDEVGHIFIPGLQSKSVDPGAKLLSEYSSKSKVLNNFKNFLQIKGIYEKDIQRPAVEAL